MGAKKVITLVLAVAVIIVITLIITDGAKKQVAKNSLQDLRTNMLLIQAKAKSTTETVNVETSNLKQDQKDIQKVEAVKNQNLKGTKLEECEENIKNEAKKAGITDPKDFYNLSQENLDNMGINIKIAEGEYYLVKYNFEDTEVVYTKGYEYKGTTYYKLSEMKNIEL